MSKKKRAKNFIILLVSFALAIGATLYLCNWYKVYDEYQKQTPVIRGTLLEITSEEELNNFLLENRNATIYICTSSETKCRNFEKDLKKLIEQKNLQSAITYLNISNVDQADFVANFNNNYPNKVNLKTNYPAFITFEDGKVKYILQGNDKEKLTITKTKQYFELNKIGEEE